MRPGCLRRRCVTRSSSGSSELRWCRATGARGAIRSSPKRRPCQARTDRKPSSARLDREQVNVHFSFFTPPLSSPRRVAHPEPPMAKASKTAFVCQSCGTAHVRWQGRCEGCGEWNTVVEELLDSGVGAGPKMATAGGRPVELVPLSGETETAARVTTGLAELDRVTGGGFVMGSAVLVGGEPGIGKSTLLLQAAAALASQGERVGFV